MSYHIYRLERELDSLNKQLVEAKVCTGTLAPPQPHYGFYPLPYPPSLLPRSLCPPPSSSLPFSLALCVCPPSIFAISFPPPAYPFIYIFIDLALPLLSSRCAISVSISLCFSLYFLLCLPLLCAKFSACINVIWMFVGALLHSFRTFVPWCGHWHKQTPCASVWQAGQAQAESARDVLAKTVEGLRTEV